MTGTVLAVCAAGHDVALTTITATAIDKRPTDARVSVTELGLATDHVCDTKHHGGLDQAVYSYDDAEARRWADELGRDLPFGWFGENLRIAGMNVTDAIVGERWAVGEDGLILETTIPRVPCRTFAEWSGEDRWIQRFTDRSDIGAYLRVITAGTVGAGDTVTVVDIPDHGVSVRDLFRGTDNTDGLNKLLATPGIAPKVHRDATRILKRTTRSAGT